MPQNISDRYINLVSLPKYDFTLKMLPSPNFSDKWHANMQNSEKKGVSIYPYFKQKLHFGGMTSSYDVINVIINLFSQLIQPSNVRARVIWASFCRICIFARGLRRGNTNFVLFPYFDDDVTTLKFLKNPQRYWVYDTKHFVIQFS